MWKMSYVNLMMLMATIPQYDFKTDGKPNVSKGVAGGAEVIDLWQYAKEKGDI